LVNRDPDCDQRFLLKVTALPTNNPIAPKQTSSARNLPGNPPLNRVSAFCGFSATAEY